MKTDFSSLQKAFDSLQFSFDFYQKSSDERVRSIARDSVIQRFEYSVETARKLMSRYLQNEYGKSKDELKTKNVFRFMEGYGKIQNWERWSLYMERRNDTSHEYDEAKADELMALIPEVMTALAFFLTQMQKDKA